MKKVYLQKCPKCNRIQKHGKWVWLTELEVLEQKNLAFLICNDQVDWHFIKCRDCLKE